MYVSSPQLGRLGILPDMPQQVLPFGAWRDARNVRFNDGSIERIKDPEVVLDTSNAKWLQLFDDGIAPSEVYASDTKLFRRNTGTNTWEDVTNTARGDYTAGGEWHSFQYGTSVVFNNGIDPPQILFANTNEFVDMPNWGVVSGAQSTVSCRALRLFGVYMVAMDVTIDGKRSRNAVWTSDPAVIDNISTADEMPSWDYADPATRSTLNYIGVEYGPIIDGLELNNNFMVYTRQTCHILQLVGGTFVFNNRKVLPYGIVSLGAVAAFNNFHFCVGPANLYVHDGSTDRPIADGKVNDDFYKRLADFENIKCTEIQQFKEIHTLFNEADNRAYLIYNYQENTFSYGDARIGSDPVQCIAYGIRPPRDLVTYETVNTTYETETRSYEDLETSGEKRATSWLARTCLYIAEQSILLDPTKDYYVDRDEIDFSEINAALTTEKSKSLHHVVPHIDGSATARFIFDASQSLGASPHKTQVFDFDPVNQYKIDPRLTGRWLSYRIEITGNGMWRVSSMDYDIESTDDR